MINIFDYCQCKNERARRQLATAGNIRSTGQIRGGNRPGRPFCQIQTVLECLFPSPPPRTTHRKPSIIQLNVPLHKVIFAFKTAMNRPYFQELFKVLDYNRLYYEIIFQYDTYSQVLKRHEEDELTLVLMEIFANFQYDASAIVKCFSLILHVYMTQIKNKKEKKVCLIIQNFP